MKLMISSKLFNYPNALNSYNILTELMKSGDPDLLVHCLSIQITPCSGEIQEYLEIVSQVLAVDKQLKPEVLTKHIEFSRQTHRIRVEEQITQIIEGLYHRLFETYAIKLDITYLSKFIAGIIQKSVGILTMGIQLALLGSQALNSDIMRDNSDEAVRFVGEFDRLEMLGEGTYGIVFLAKDRQTNQTVAIKQMRVLDQHDGFPITSLRQIKILKTLSRHPNIITLQDVVVGKKKDSVFLVFEYCDIDLAKLIDQMFVEKISFSEGEIKSLVLQLIKGGQMNYVHDKYIIHRDLKLSNLLLSKDGILRIADFGLARQICNLSVIQIPLKPITRKVVTLWYRAPQLLIKTREYGTSIDVWSIGCIFAQLLQKGQPLFRGSNQLTQFQAICELIGYPTKNSWPEFFSESRKQARKEFEKCGVYRKNILKQHFQQLSGSKSCADLFSRIMCWDPADRISLHKMLSHPYFMESPKPVFPDELKILNRLQFYSKRSIDDLNRRRK